MTSRELIDIVSPEHGRTSCNDNCISNGLYLEGDRLRSRCTRCALLEIESEELDYGNNFSINMVML